MKFDYCIGNPPYQGTNHFQIYPDFYVASRQIARNVELIFPTGWQQPKTANGLGKLNTKDIKEDKRIVWIKNISGAFPGVIGAEWVNVVLWKDNYDNGLGGKQRIITNDENEEIIKLSTNALEISLPEQVNSILKKVQSKTDKSVSDQMHLQNKYDLNALYSDYPEMMDKIGSDGKDKRIRNNHFPKIVAFHSEKGAEDMLIYGNINNNRVNRFINKKYVSMNHPLIMSYKVLIAEAAAAGTFGEKLSDMIIAPPNTGFTQTFIGVGGFASEIEAQNFVKYIKGKFARTLLYTLKNTQHNGIPTWKNIPVQDYSANSDINWNVSIKDIDRQLYKKYGLSQEEINFIETHVKEME